MGISPLTPTPNQPTEQEIMATTQKTRAGHTMVTLANGDKVLYHKDQVLRAMRENNLVACQALESVNIGGFLTLLDYLLERHVPWRRYH